MNYAVCYNSANTTQYLALAEGELSAGDFAAWLRDRIKSEPADLIQESRPKRGRPKSKSQVKRLAAQRGGRRRA